MIERKEEKKEKREVTEDKRYFFLFLFEKKEHKNTFVSIFLSSSNRKFVIYHELHKSK